MNKTTQRLWVIQQLELYGSVTRNQALSNFISRLGAIINVLKNEGWDITGKNRGGDYIYTLAPVKPTKPRYEIVNGVAIQVW